MAGPPPRAYPDRPHAKHSAAPPRDCAAPAPARNRNLTRGRQPPHARAPHAQTPYVQSLDTPAPRAPPAVCRYRSARSLPPPAKAAPSGKLAAPPPPCAPAPPATPAARAPPSTSTPVSLPAAPPSLPASTPPAAAPPATLRHS